MRLGNSYWNCWGLPFENRLRPLHGPNPRLNAFDLTPMKHNVIILTSGLTGSSVLTGLIARAGYWPGDRTHKKKEFDTYENEELIDLNRRIFEQANYHGNYLMDFSPGVLAR